MRGQQGNIFAAVAQRRQAEIDHVEPVEEVFAEASLFDHDGQIAIGGGHDAGLDGDAMGGADGTDFLLLQRAQQLGLKVQSQLADLVEKDRASFGGDKEAVFGLDGAR
jgi:hypothetical protein